MMNEPKVGTKNVPLVILLFSLALLFMQSGQAFALTQYTGTAAMTCSSCHGMPPRDAAVRDWKTGAFMGNHSTHNPRVGTAGVHCNKCHIDNGSDLEHYTGVIQMSARINGYSTVGSAARYNKPTFFNQTTRPVMATCSNVNCHFETATGSWNAARLAYPAGCAYCHGAAPASGSHPSATGSGAKHGTYYGTGASSCLYCHPNHVTFDHATSIGKRALILQFTAAPNTTGAYSLTSNLNYPNFLPSKNSTKNGSCSTMYCHSNGNGTTVTATWGGTLPADCTGCHGGAAASASPMATGKHGQHISNANAGGSFGCVDCHNTTVSSNTVIATVANHVNKIKNYAGTNAGTITTAGSGTCRTVYCHSNGQSTPVYRNISGTWNSATTYGCASCHGADTTGPAGVFTSLFGAPNYTNYTTNNSIYRNTHTAKHITTIADCQTCHYTTTDTAGNILPAPNAHIDRTRTVVFNTANPSLTTASYNAAAKTCTNVCHGTGTTVKWGSTITGSGCLTCHSNIAASGAHAAHIGTLIQTVTFYAYTANKSSGSELTSGTSYALGCANCHPINATLHQNGTINVEVNNITGVGTLRTKNPATAAVTVVTSKSSVTCANIYCHSDGQATPTYAAIPNWYGGKFTTDKCANCHGNSPTSGAHVIHVVGIHNDDVFNGRFGKYSSAAAVGKPAGHGDPSQSTTINCNICHNLTTNVAYNDQNSSCVSCHTTKVKGNAAITNRAYHVNGRTDLAFANISVRSKAQLRPDSFADYTAAGGYWNRTTYKAGAGSYDIAKQSLQKATYTGGNCANIACHNGKSINWVNPGSSATCVICHSKL